MADRFLSEVEVKARTGLSRTTRWRGARSGWFPKPRVIAPNRIAWLASEIDGYQDACAAGTADFPSKCRRPVGKRNSKERSSIGQDSDSHGYDGALRKQP
jgi:predicted DNA-binding transcriptional regulator AlpA